MNISDFKELLHRYNTGACTEEEKELLESWYHDFEFKKLPELSNEQIAEILAVKTAPPRHRIIPFVKWVSGMAAMLVICLSVGAYFLWRKPHMPLTSPKYTYDVRPGTAKAVLTLANGKTIALSADRVGKLAEQGDVAIAKTNDGQVVYSAPGTEGTTAGADLYNTLSTPRGGQYSVVLADGTKVWLNAASSIKYPVAFNGTERRVEITGEAYIEVKHDATRPFRIIAGKQIIEDLGTQFNIDSYPEEPFSRVTLITGSVVVINGKESMVLEPGQQSKLSKQEGSHLIRITDNVDIAEVTAWKNGLFKFHKASLPTVMRQLSRWYNVNVNYEGKMPDVEFSGEITRNVNISEVLDILSYLKVHFKMKQDNQNITLTVTE